ncbi:hypothetical protein A0H76_1797 [Hepatospora eriocheir]|uniref:Uncharacterized protein n=1 Tax=Hepatospora eriocheir TaxID=1081669 RepID=A0A1X0QKP6_9MICR|nr:hypothetical protein A0H76_1797 [Hepatospora eriocheir]
MIWFLLIIKLYIFSTIEHNVLDETLNIDFESEQDNFLQICFPDISEELCKLIDHEELRRHDDKSESLITTNSEVNHNPVELNNHNNTIILHELNDSDIIFEEQKISESSLVTNLDKQEYFFTENELNKIYDLQMPSRSDEIIKENPKSCSETTHDEKPINDNESQKNYNKINQITNSSKRYLDEELVPKRRKINVDSSSNQRLNDVIQYSFISKETFDFFIKISLAHCDYIKLNKELIIRYNEVINMILKRKMFSFSHYVTFNYYYMSLKQKLFDYKKLSRIANLDLITTQKHLNKFNYFECFLMRLIHVLTCKDFKEENFMKINLFINLLNHYIKYNVYLNKLKEVLDLLRRNDDNLLEKKEDLIGAIDQTFINYINILSNRDKNRLFNNIFINIKHYDLNILNNKIDTLKFSLCFKEILNSIRTEQDKDKLVLYLLKLSIIYLDFINNLCRGVIEIKNDRFFSTEKNMIYIDFLYLISSFPWNF